ncbi:hypothetical protein [Erythrobacter tepidarius]|uniref:hypothetical protein n=1 Tax=Erythrobacter tepidarius TaxID=60454 RepID=UPI000A3CD973|nr:hypothetical protein [Erythrobacter tepidarius]
MNDLSSPPRDSLRARIEAAERRNAERGLADQAREAAAAATDYARAHPLAVVGGALVLGLLVGLVTRPGRQVAARAAGAVSAAASDAASSATSGVKALAARSGSRLGTLLGEAVIAYGIQVIENVLEQSRAGQERLSDLSETAGEQARNVTAGLADTARKAARAARRVANKTED